jgi:hypothetical protein
MSNDVIYIILWLLNWSSIATLNFNLDQSRKAMASQLRLNNIQLEINRELVEEIASIRESLKFD